MDEHFSNYIIELAKKSCETGDVPIGAIVTYDNRIIGEGFNTREKDQNVFGHAEINAILAASKNINNWNLADCDLYVTLKPCSMCMEVIKQARIKNVYYLLDKPSNKKEFAKTNFIDCSNNSKSNEYLEILSTFFKDLREKK